MHLMTGLECFHFQRANGGAAARVPAPWQVGGTYDIGADHNRYFDFFYRQAQVHRQANGREARPDAHARAVLRAIAANPGRVGFTPRDGIDELRTALSGTLTALQSQCNLVRELIFEEVRRQFFPDCPSRHHCIWLAPSRPAMRFWDRRGPCDKTWFRVRLLAGRYHLADASLVRPEYQTVAELEEQAHRYWADGHDPRRANTELMFIGTLKVLERLGPAPGGEARPA